jgi:AraC family transcriptional regulator of adaptative response/methylated-DNA-[protein]-cysteine methyltransferase
MKAMKEQQQLNYERIAEAIEYINTNFKEQPALEDIAKKVHLSPFHFQKLFTEWAGTSPKKFLQYTSIQYAKKLLKENQATLFDAAFETGLSGTSRLHDLFISIEGMTPAEYKTGGKDLLINYSFAESPFGNILVASTQKGICYMAFYEEEADGLSLLQHHFPNAVFARRLDMMQQNALFIFQTGNSKLAEIKLHLKGTAFQLKVWETLLKIPQGQLTTYGTIAHHIEQPKASRAVGTAIGSNPVAFLIPCHRVIQASGALGGYMWGNTRKTAIIGWEAAKMNAAGEPKERAIVNEIMN